jgi:alpha-ribazole phosphatase
LIYLIRHTKPLVDKGICYGQSDLDVVDTFISEANIIKTVLPPTITNVYSSPLQRCSKLANELFPNHEVKLDANLMELNCGDWEMQHWDDIPKQEIDPWMENFVDVVIPNGESYTMLYHRITTAFNAIITAHNAPIAIVAHGGVLRSILSYITHTPLIDSFDRFKIHYGAVFQLTKDANGFTYNVLSNIETPKEQHQPSNY